MSACQWSTRCAACVDDRRIDGLAVFDGLDPHLMAGQINLNAGRLVNLLDGFGDYVDKMAAGQVGRVSSSMVDP